MDDANSYYDYKIIILKSLNLFKSDFIDMELDKIYFKYEIKCYYRLSELHNLLKRHLKQVDYPRIIKKINYKSLITVLGYYQDELIEDLELSLSEYENDRAIKELPILCSMLENLPFYNKVLRKQKFNKRYTPKIAKEIKMLKRNKVAFDIFEKATNYKGLRNDQNSVRTDKVRKRICNLEDFAIDEHLLGTEFDSILAELPSKEQKEYNDLKEYMSGRLNWKKIQKYFEK